MLNELWRKVRHRLKLCTTDGVNLSPPSAFESLTHSPRECCTLRRSTGGEEEKGNPNPNPPRGASELAPTSSSSVPFPFCERLRSLPAS